MNVEYPAMSASAAIQCHGGFIPALKSGTFFSNLRNRHAFFRRGRLAVDMTDLDDQFAALLSVGIGLFAISLVVLDGGVTTYAGLLMGLGLVAAAGLLRYRETAA